MNPLPVPQRLGKPRWSQRPLLPEGGAGCPPRPSSLVPAGYTTVPRGAVVSGWALPERPSPASSWRHLPRSWPLGSGDRGPHAAPDETAGSSARFTPAHPDLGCSGVAAPGDTTSTELRMEVATRLEQPYSCSFWGLGA